MTQLELALSAVVEAGDHAPSALTGHVPNQDAIRFFEIVTGGLPPANEMEIAAGRAAYRAYHTAFWKGPEIRAAAASEAFEAVFRPG